MRVRCDDVSQPVPPPASTTVPVRMVMHTGVVMVMPARAAMPTGVVTNPPVVMPVRMFMPAGIAAGHRVVTPARMLMLAEVVMPTARVGLPP